MKSQLWLGSALASLVLCATFALHAADEDTKPATGKAAAKADGGKLKGRLPNGYSKIVDDKQREKIYAIQASYEEKIAALEKELADLEAKRNAEIKAVLSPEQLKKLEEAAAEAKAKKPAPDAKAADKDDAKSASK